MSVALPSIVTAYPGGAVGRTKLLRLPLHRHFLRNGIGDDRDVWRRRHHLDVFKFIRLQRPVAVFRHLAHLGLRNAGNALRSCDKEGSAR
jgi:hypothetical protein